MLANIKICNLKFDKPKLPYQIRVDRTSPLGNPFHMKTEAQRDMVCDRYELWIADAVLEKTPSIIEELNKLYFIYKKYGRLELYCWCYPKRCHAETIKRLLIDALNR